MRPVDIYALPCVEETRCLGELKGFYYDHLTEFSKKYWIDSYYDLEEANTRIIVKTHVDHSFDGRRVWTIRTVWFDSFPVMICQNAGREGDDHRERFITSKEAFINMLLYLETLMDPELREEYEHIFPIEEFKVQTHDEFEEMPRLTSFYGYSLPYVLDEYH